MYKPLIIKRLLIFIIAVLFISFSVSALDKSSLVDVDIPSFDVISPYVDSNKYTHKKSDAFAFNQQNFFNDPIEIVTSSGIAYLDEESLAFQVVNGNGYIWSSTIDYDVEGLPNTFKQRARSAIILESYNSEATNFAITEENLFTNDTVVATQIITNGFHSTITFGRSGITIGLYVTFGYNKITVEIPDNEIDESGIFKISSIKVYPYFGAVLEDSIPGYVFLPDGIGALIDYKTANPLVSTNYQKEIYDRNIGYNTETNMNNFLSGGTRIYAPVFGFVHGVNQNAVFAEIKDGAPYGMINLYFPARTRGYTTVFAEFVFRKTYRQPIDKVGNTISLLQQFSNAVSIKIEYTLLENEDANYVGMAKAYRDSLSSELNKNDFQFDDIPLKLDTIGIERKEGLLFPKTIVMTTFEQFHEIVKDLNDKEIYHIIGNYQGFTKQGVTWSAPNYEKASLRLGNMNDLEELSRSLTELYFVTEYMKASNRSSGYNQYFDLAKKINDQLYQYLSSTDQKYLLQHDKMEALLLESYNELKKYPIDGLAIQSMGSLLYDDFSKQNYLPELIDVLKSSLDSIDAQIALYDVNQYLWGHVSNFYDFPMYSSQYITFDDTVPFLSIVLSGSVQLFGPHANFYPYARDELLRLIDFGVYPSFIVTHESSIKLQETGLESIYSSRYQDIQYSIDTYYHFVNDALKHVIGANINYREVIENGVVSITYDNHIQIVVNYRSTTFIYADQTIDAKSYIIIKLDEE
ncbi:MAG: DUF5696 domain-containing protein [Tenericutes bacterium]|nr:DUF5696 domain-containing protein [Mycoplasmatota bacterium]